MSKTSPADKVLTLGNIEMEVKELFINLKKMKEEESAAQEIRKQLQKDIEYKQTELEKVNASMETLQEVYDYKKYSKQEQTHDEQTIKEKNELYNELIQQRINTTKASLDEVAMNSQKYQDTIEAYKMLANLSGENTNIFLEEIKEKYAETEVSEFIAQLQEELTPLTIEGDKIALF